MSLKLRNASRQSTVFALWRRRRPQERALHHGKSACVLAVRSSDGFQSMVNFAYLSCAKRIAVPLKAVAISA
jgi:hypothetical protein